MTYSLKKDDSAMKRFGKIGLSIAIIALGIATGPVPSAKAASLTYDYTGNAFDTTDPYLPGTVSGLSQVLGSSVTAAVTFNSAVTSNFTGQVGANDITAFTLSTGKVSLSLNTPNINDGGAFTFNDGKITSWSFNAINVSNGVGYAIGTSSTNGGFFNDLITGYTNTGNGYIGEIGASTPGSWSQVSPVPLPGALPLFASAIAGVAGFGMRRMRRIKAA